jgi:hypothetical protein
MAVLYDGLADTKSGYQVKLMRVALDQVGADAFAALTSGGEVRQLADGVSDGLRDKLEAPKSSAASA